MNLSIDQWLKLFPGSQDGFLSSFKFGFFDSELLLPRTQSHSYCLELHGIFSPKKYLSLNYRDTVIGDAALISDGTLFLGQANYWHFLVDGLGTIRESHRGLRRLFFREDVPPAWMEFVVQLCSYRFSARAIALESMPIGDIRLENIGSPWVGVLSGRLQLLRSHILHFMRHELPANRFPEVVWVSRRSASKRRLINEDVLIQIVKRHLGAVEIVDPSLMSIAEQAKVFSGATYVIGPHGAGLVNALFSDRLTALIELYHSSRQSFYPSVASVAGGRHFGVRGHAVESTENPSRSDNADFVVDEGAFRATLRELGSAA